MSSFEQKQLDKKLDVVAIGETMVLFLTEPARPLREAHTFVRSVAGAESNVAIGVARLGLKAAWCGRVGDDALGLNILDRLSAEGVDVSRAIIDPDGWTGVLVRDRHHERRVSVAYARRGSAGSGLIPADVDADWIASARVLHVTGITPALSVTAAETVGRAIELARAAGVDVSFDVNHRRRLWTDEHAAPILRSLLPGVNILFATQSELAMVSGNSDLHAAAKWTLGVGAERVIVKRGVNGAIAFSADEVVETPAPRVTVVDPVGAGDAFVAGYLSAFLSGEALTKCLEQGCRTGAAAVQIPGDIEGLPWGSGGLFHPQAESDVDR